MSVYDDAIETAIELIEEFGAKADIVDIPGTGIQTGEIYAVKIPTTAGESSSPNDRYGTRQDTSQTTATARILVAGTPMPTIKRGYKIRVGDYDYQVVDQTLLEPDFTSKIFIDCTCFEA